MQTQPLLLMEASTLRVTKPGRFYYQQTIVFVWQKKRHITTLLRTHTFACHQPSLTQAYCDFVAKRYHERCAAMPRKGEQWVPKKAEISSCHTLHCNRILASFYQSALNASDYLAATRFKVAANNILNWPTGLYPWEIDEKSKDLSFISSTY